MFNYINGGLDISHKLDYASSPKDQYSKHMHCFYEVLYFVDGDVDYTVESLTKKLHPGDLILIQPGKYHFATVNRNVLYERYVLKFPDDIIPDILKERLKGADPFFYDSRSDDFIFKEMDSYFIRFDDEVLGVVLKSKIIELLSLLSQEKKSTVKSERASLRSLMIDYIEKHLNTDLSLKKMAEDLNYSESYLSGTFRKEMKTPLMQYVRSKKIISAHSLILHGEKPQTVSSLMGFKDYSTFYRCYMKVIGVSPSKTRKSER